MNFIGSIITDCGDDNAKTRQQLRFADLFGSHPSFVSLGSQQADLEAAGHLVDQIDVLSRRPQSRTAANAIIIVNVAPRGDRVKKQYPNGTPFCYFKIGHILVVSTWAGQALSLVSQLGLVDQVQLMDIPTVTSAAVSWSEITFEQAANINNSQFRSLEFAPLAAYWLSHDFKVPATPQPIPPEQYVQQPSGHVWFVDNFGNAKTTLSPQDIDWQPGSEVQLSNGQTALCCPQLADAPVGQTVLTVGSSGYDQHRFLEVVTPWTDSQFDPASLVQRKSLNVGDPVLKIEEA